VVFVLVFDHIDITSISSGNSGNLNIVGGKLGQVIGSPMQPGEGNQVILAIGTFQMANWVVKLDCPLNWVTKIRRFLKFGHVRWQIGSGKWITHSTG
jgi:hypothetical protein